MSVLKSLYYVGGFTIGGYFLMKFVERDPELLRKELPERHETNYSDEAQKRNAAFMQILKNVSQGDDPQTASRKLREQYEKEKLRTEKAVSKAQES